RLPGRMLWRGGVTVAVVESHSVSTGAARGRHGRGTTSRRRPALPGRIGRGFPRRAGGPSPLGPGRPPAAPAVRHASVPELPAPDPAAAEPPGGRNAWGRRGAAAQGAPPDPAGNHASVLCPGLPAHALGVE